MLTRRRFMELSCAASSLPLLGACGDGATASPVEGRLAAELESLGFVEVTPQPLAADYDFNDGYRYDEYPMNSAGARSFVVQPCRRVEDADSRRLLVLPLFHMVVWDTSPPIGAASSTRIFLDLLLGTLGLDPRHVAAVTADDFVSPLAILEEAGIGRDQTFVRSAAEARRTGDGSGWFGPRDYPGPTFPTVSLHYSREAPTAGRVTGYPLPVDMVEIGECFETGAGIGIERAAWAAAPA